MPLSAVLAIPAAFPVLVQGVVQALLYERFREFIEQDLPKIAEEQERRLTAELAALAVGDDFYGLKVVGASTTTVTLFNSMYEQKAIYPIFDKFPPSTEAIPGLVFDLVRVSVEIKRTINLTNSKRPLLDFVDIAEFTIEITIKYDPYTFRIGGGFDKLRNLEQYLVGIDIAAPSLRFRGYLARGGPGGFIIWVHSGLPLPVPLGTTPFGLYGIGLEYGERFVPRLTKDVPKDPIEELGKASAREYAAWARSNVLEKWTPVSRDVRVYGITADIGDLGSNGSVVKTQATGLTYLSWGPTLVLEGYLKLLETEIATVVGAIDFRSRSLFFSANSHVVVFKNVLDFNGSVEGSASLHDQNLTWVAVGGYDMNGCAVSILNGLFELRGGLRVVPLQGAAVRAAGRVRAEVEICGFGGGYSFSIAIVGQVGWNPVEIGGQLYVGGSAWIRAFGVTLGAGVNGSLVLQLPQPKRLTLRVEFSFDPPWPLPSVKIPLQIFNFKKDEVQYALAGLALGLFEPIGFFHACSGTNGQIGTEVEKVWPDISFELPFRRIARGSPIIVNKTQGDGIVREAGITTAHEITDLRIVKVDEDTGNEEVLPNLSAAWMGMKAGVMTDRTSRLAFPSNDPLAWLQTFEYAQPEVGQPIEKTRIQTFGSGPDEEILPGLNGRADLELENLRVSHPRVLRLFNLSWGAPYARALVTQSLEIVVADIVGGTGNSLPVRRYDIRLVGTDVYLRANGNPIQLTKVRDLEKGSSEWSAVIERRGPEQTQPMRIDGSDHDQHIVAIGYTLDLAADYAPGSETIFAPGIYKLRVNGFSTASYGTNTKRTEWDRVERKFQVVPPDNLRPYLRYSTFGDERLFEVSYPGWNPNPIGTGFGHYRAFQGTVRAKVSYLSRIYDRLWVSPGQGIPPVPIAVKVCTDGAVAGGSVGTAWPGVVGVPPRLEEELIVQLPNRPGDYKLELYRSALGDGTDLFKVDEWPYRVSTCANPAEHVRPTRNSLSEAWGPFGRISIGGAPEPDLPAGFDFGAVAAADLIPGWTLPSWIRKLPELTDPDAGVGYLQLLDWSGILAAPDGLPPASTLAPTAVPQLDVLMDWSDTPASFLLRTSEPVDWRRIAVTAVRGERGGQDFGHRFETRIVPSPDGCSAALLLLAEEVPIRVPSGRYAMQVVFALRKGSLPPLVELAVPGRAAFTFRFTFEQTFGRPWHA